MARTKTQAASGETKATAAGATAGAATVAVIGPHIGIAALGTAVAGTALLPATLTIGLGAVLGFAAYKVHKDLKAKRSKQPDNTKLR